MRMRVESGERRGDEFEVGQKALVIGRDQACDLVIPDPEVSRRHAVLRRVSGGYIEIENLSQANGTFVDGERIQASKELAGDEQIRIGSTVLRARREPESALPNELVHGSAATGRRDSRSG